MSEVFFKPNTELVKWLIEYADDRIIIDIGCGEKFLLSQQLIANGAKKVVAIDPLIDWNHHLMYKQLNYDKLSKISFHVLPQEGQRWKDFYTDKCLMVFARPCHSDFVEECLLLKFPNTEALYITVPENLERYDDLGIFKQRAKLLEHKGKSADNEVIYSII